MRTFVEGNLTVHAFDERVYLQSRNILRVKVSGAPTRVILWQGHYTNPVAMYTLDANNEAVVDVTDLLRLDARGRAIGDALQSIGIKADADYVTVTSTIGGLIDPRHVLIPKNTTDERIIPPNMMYEAMAGVPNAVEFYVNDVCECGLWDVHEAPLQGVDVPADIPYIVSQEGAYYYYLLTFNDAFAKISCRPWECGKRYAAVRWVSFSGRTRVNVWEIRDAENSVGEVVNLESVDGSYNPLKGRVDGFTLYLDELSAYDMWYYADVITSSRVEVSFDGVEWQQVEVQTKSVQLPNSDAGAANKLEIPVKWRQYDAFTL